MRCTSNKTDRWGVLLAASYLVGVGGLLNAQSRPLFAALVPLHLLFAGGLLFAAHGQWNAAFAKTAIATGLAGWLVEAVGVATGFPFGNYTYGTVLGAKLLGVPLLIAFNWLALVYAAGTVFHKLRCHWALRAAAVAATLALLDLLMEPVAVRLGFWYWSDSGIPLQNYAAWFVVAWSMAAVFYKARFSKANPMGQWFLGSQFLFFGLLNAASRHAGA